MPVNSDKPERWKADIVESVSLYNKWFLEFAPKAYRDTRVDTAKEVESAFKRTANLTDITPAVLKQYPSVLPMLRMATAPPIARDRLVGLAGVSRGLVYTMEDERRIPPRMDTMSVDTELRKIGQVIIKLADRDIVPWLDRSDYKPNDEEIRRAATIIADRLCGTTADPIIRNAQEQRQFSTMGHWLEDRGYSEADDRPDFDNMRAGTFAYRINVPVSLEGTSARIRIPIDVVIMPLRSQPGDLPVMIEAKSAGDFTNVNKRRKEEAKKITQLRSELGEKLRYVLFLCGYFDTGYLGYEAAEGIDWIWEHSIDDFAELGI